MDAWAAMSDEELLLEFAATLSDDVFAAVVERFGNAIRLVAWRMLRNSDDADDAVQVTLLRVWGNAYTYNGTARAFTWICAIVRNEALNIIRRRRFNKRHVFSNANTFILTQAPDREVEARNSEELLALRAAVANLPNKERSVVELVDLAEEQYEVAAAELDVPIGTIRSRRHRALNRLREMMLVPSS